MCNRIPSPPGSAPRRARVAQGLPSRKEARRRACVTPRGDPAAQACQWREPYGPRHMVSITRLWSRPTSHGHIWISGSRGFVVLVSRVNDTRRIDAFAGLDGGARAGGVSYIYSRATVTLGRSHLLRFLFDQLHVKLLAILLSLLKPR